MAKKLPDNYIFARKAAGGILAALDIPSGARLLSDMRKTLLRRMRKEASALLKVCGICKALVYELDLPDRPALSDTKALDYIVIRGNDLVLGFSDEDEETYLPIHKLAPELGLLVLDTVRTIVNGVKSGAYTVTDGVVHGRED